MQSRESDPGGLRGLAGSAFLLAAVVEAVFAIAVFCGVAFETVISVRVGAHG